MKIFLTVVVVGLLIVVVDLLVGIAHIVTAPEGRTGNAIGAQRLLPMTDYSRADSQLSFEAPWSTGVPRC